MILVVVSHPGTRDALIPLVAAKGYQVAGVECGDEVLKRLRFQPASLVIIDCDFPDSFEMLAKIREQAHTRSTPIVMFSEDNEAMKKKALDTGADAYVPKGSLDWAELVDAIDRFVGPPSPAL